MSMRFASEQLAGLRLDAQRLVEQAAYSRRRARVPWQMHLKARHLDGDAPTMTVHLVNPEPPVLWCGCDHTTMAVRARRGYAGFLRRPAALRTKRWNRSTSAACSLATSSGSGFTPATRFEVRDRHAGARTRGATVIFGGIHATLYPDEAQSLGGAHAVVKGDGDVVWPLVLERRGARHA